MDRIGSRFYTEATLRASPVALEKAQRMQEYIETGAVGTRYDVFLSHSSRDKSLVLNFAEKLKQLELTCYIDWLNDSDANRLNIATKLQLAMHNSASLIYLHTSNSRHSVWTPWEIGYYNGEHGPKKIGVAPVLTGSTNSIPSYVGHEYLLTYREVGVDALPQFVRGA